MGEEVIKLDFMVKRAQMKAKLLRTENFKGRWFKLTPKYLYYCDGKIESGCGKVKGTIPLSCITVVEEAETESLGNRPNAFLVTYKCEELQDEACTLYVMAHRQEVKDEWIEALRAACQKCGAEFAAKYHPGVWNSKLAKFSCCESINKRSVGCIPVNNPLFTGRRPANGSNTLPLPNARIQQVERSQKSTSMLSRNPTGVYVVALYSHKAKGRDNIDLVKGAEYELLEEYRSSANWLLARDSSGSVGQIPANYVQLVGVENMEQYDWFYKNTSRMQSESILEEDGREGCFMIRDSSQPGVFTLSLLVSSGKAKTAKHYHIKQKPDNSYYLVEKHSFMTIQELIYYHKHNAAGLIARLRFPPSDRVKPSLIIDAEEFDPADIEMKDRLGAGQFGEVTRAIYHGDKQDIEVAVKTLKEGSMSEEDFVDEAKVMVKLKHNHLVTLHGVCTKKRPIMIITEYMKNGALLHFLKRHKHLLIDKTSQLLDMCMQVCSAMEFLEKNGCIHRDLAARNCLVGENNVVKVADFGLTRFVIDDEYTSSFGSKYPVRWSAPEVLGYTKFSSKSDVWAFGILMWEVFTCGDMPYGSRKNADVVDDVCHKHIHLSKPERCPDIVYDIMLDCWHQNADGRPSFSKLYSDLRELMERDYVQ